MSHHAPPHFIDTPEGLARLAGELRGLPALAVDLEGDSLHHYGEKVCLLQVSSPGGDWLVDTLAVGNLGPLADLLADPAVRKVFHAGDNDIRAIHRDFGVGVRNVFDTLVACQFTGEEKIGLADVLKKTFGLEVDKRLQKADWSIRPLTPAMMDYAAGDTRHLLPLADILEARLREVGRHEWAAEEFVLLEGARQSTQEGPFFLRFKGAGHLPPRSLAALERILVWRDETARKRDVPPFRILGNDPIFEVAKALPKTPAELKEVTYVTPPVLERHGRKLLDLVAAALALPDGELPVYPRGERLERDLEAEKRLEKLKAWRVGEAARYGMSPGILINNALLEELSRRPPLSAADLSGFPLMKGWQRAALGPGILSALA
jgi:ribonuclease D